MTEKKAEKDIFDDSNFGADTEISGNTIDWHKVGDYVVGTFVKARHNVETVHGENSIYELFCEKGTFHKKDGTEVIVNKGDTYSVWGRNDLFDGQMNSLKPGQVIKLTFAEERPSKQGNPAKIIKIFAPKNNDGSVVMNATWLEAQSVTGGDF